MLQWRKYFGEHFAAIAAAIMLHTGMAAWAMQPSSPIVIRQQVMQISMVAPSSLDRPEQQKAVDPSPVTPLKDKGMKSAKKVEKKHTQKQEVEKTQQKPSIAQQTSGPQALDATDKVAARTDPVFDAAYLQNPPPVYPSSARRSGVQGKVLLTVNVTAAGTAGNVSVASSSGHSLLDTAAMEAVRRWKFVPAKRGSEIVEAKVLVPVEFKLRK